MLCSTTRLLFTVALWRSPEFFERISESYKNHTEGQSYDCALLTVPCESNITKALFPYDDDTVFWFDLIHTYIFMTLVNVVGIVGNVINIIIFSTTKVANDSTNSLLLALSVSDLANLLNNCIFVFTSFLCFIDVSLALTVTNIGFAHNVILNRWVGLLSVDLVTAISIQRAVAVLLPFKVATIFSHRNTIIIILGLYLICFCTLLPASVGFVPRWVFHIYFKKYISLGYTYRMDFMIWMKYMTRYPTIRSCCVLSILMVCGSLTVLKLIWQAKSRLSMTSKKSSSQDDTPKMSPRELSAIKMSVAVCFFTFIVYSFSTGVNFFLEFYAEQFTDSIVPVLFVSFIIMVFSINSSFNFFLYLIMCRKFKDKCGQLFSSLIIWH